MEIRREFVIALVVLFVIALPVLFIALFSGAALNSAPSGYAIYAFQNGFASYFNAALSAGDNIIALAAKGTSQGKSGARTVPQCNDHIDNDKDGFCDFAWKQGYCSDGSRLGDVGCVNKLDTNESKLCVNKDCSSLNTQCTVGVCDTLTGNCKKQPVSGSCDDGILCTINDSCNSGTCRGTADNSKCSSWEACSISQGCIQTSCSSCENCDAWFASCDYVKCHAECEKGIGCYYRGALFFEADCVSTTYACTTLISSCANYSMEECQYDPCHVGTLGGCMFDGTSCVEGVVCTPKTCSELGKNCGSWGDGCGGTLNCGSCTAPLTCQSGVCACAPTACVALGKNCGSWPNGCGGALNCGTCSTGKECSNGTCVDIAQTFRFVSWADTKSYKDTLAALSVQAKALNPKFTIYEGDLCDAYSTTCIQNDWVSAMNGYVNNGMADITFAVRGNHDSGNDAGWQSIFNFSAMAARVGAIHYSYMSGLDDIVYSFDYGNSHFVGLDSLGDADTITSSQLTWLDNDLTSAEGRGLTHAFIYFHGTIYCVDGHCTCTTPSGCSQDSTTDNGKIIPIINKHPIVSATFHGHEHTYAWVHLDNTRVSAITHPWEEFVTAAAGAGPYACISGRTDYCLPQYGFVTVDVDGATVTVNFYRKGYTSSQKTVTFTKT